MMDTTGTTIIKMNWQGKNEMTLCYIKKNLLRIKHILKFQNTTEIARYH